MRSSRSSTNHAFTITELVVVIGIILLLIGILFPVISSVRAASNTTRCIANQRELVLGLTNFCADSKGALPLYNGGYNWWQTTLKGFLPPDGKVFICPSTREPDISTASAFLLGNSTTQYYVAGASNRFGSYGFNLILDFSRKSNSGVVMDESMIHNMGEASYGVVATSDCIWTGFSGDCTWGATVIPSPQETVTGGQTPAYVATGYSSYIGRCFIDRHRGKIVVGMTDGSAKAIPLRDLWGGVRMTAQGFDRRSAVAAMPAGSSFPKGY